MANRVKNRRFEMMHDDVLAHTERRSTKPKPKRDSANLVPGIVLRARGHHYDVRTTENEVRRERLCEVRGRMLAEKQFDTLVAVGDRVWILPDGEDRGQIERVGERQSKISRQRPGAKMDAEDVILANPDQVLIVLAAAEPTPHPRMLDRFLVIAEANDLPAIICINKLDLVDAAALKAIFCRYEEIGYTVIYTSTETGEGVDTVRDVLTDRITVVTGPSGVGKSRLINAIHPALKLRVGDLRDYMQKGKHTTRGAQLFHLPFGDETYIADTPGIRELGLFDIDPSNLPFYFIEMKPFLQDCRFSGCTHDHEPDCAVRKAVEQGKIASERHESYLILLHGDES